MARLLLSDKENEGKEANDDRVRKLLFVFGREELMVTQAMSLFSAVNK